MTKVRTIIVALYLVVLDVGLSAAAQDKDAERRETVTGAATAKGGGSDQAALKAVNGTEVGSRVRLE